MSAGAGEAEKQELWVDQREEVGVSGDVDTPLEEGTLGRRQAGAAAEWKPRPAGSFLADGGSSSGNVAAANQRAAGKFKLSAEKAAAAAAAKGADSSTGGAQGNRFVRDPEEDDDLALPAFKKPSSHVMPLLGSVSDPPYWLSLLPRNTLHKHL